MEATVEAVTTKDGDAVFQVTKAFFEGQKTPFHLNNSVRLITKENVETMIPWSSAAYIEALSAGKVFAIIKNWK